MPRPFRINAETGIKEFDDSFEPFEGKCTKCGTLHKGVWEICDNCIDTLAYERGRQLQAEQDAYEQAEYLDYCNKQQEEEENPCSCSEDSPKHLCPFSLEIHGNERECNCCDSCSHECAISI